MGGAVGLLVLLGVGALCFWAVLVAHTVRSLLNPKRRRYSWALARNVAGDPGELDAPLGFETLSVEGDAGRIEFWRVRGRDPSGARVVMIHGWGSSKIGALKRMEGVVDAAREVVAIDLRGHGDSDGRCALGTSEHRDVIRVLGEIDHDGPLVLFGWSLGAGVALRVALEGAGGHGVSGVVCEAPYVEAPTPARNVMRLSGMPTFMNLEPAMWVLGVRLGVGASWRGFARDGIARRVAARVLVVHGTADPVCPVGDGRDIADAAPGGSIVEVEGGGHNNLWTDPALRGRVVDAVRGFVRDQSSSRM